MYYGITSRGEGKTSPLPIPHNRAIKKGNIMTDSVIGTFGTYTKPEKANKYDETMAAFAEALKTNPDASWTVEVDSAKETVERNLIAKAANKIGHTASLKHSDYSRRTQVGSRERSGNPVYQGVSVLTFVLTDQHKPRRGKDAEVEAPAKPKSK